MIKIIRINVLIEELGLIVLYLISVMYITLLERKLMGRIQRRVGPQLILQSMYDGIKLIVKERLYIKEIEKLIYNIIIIISLILNIYHLKIQCSGNILYNIIDKGILYLLLISSLTVYPLVLSGINSKNKYSIIGSIRVTIQMISYEIYIGILILIIIKENKSVNILKYIKNQIIISNINSLCLIILLLIIIILCETSRSPFDLSECESELVAGYQIEYSSILLTIILLSEYGMLLLLSYLLIQIIFNDKKIYFIILIVILILIRSIYPRLRQDLLLSLGWKYLLPLSMNIYIYYIYLFI